KAPPDFFSFAAPYAVEVWIWIGGAYFVTSISLFVMGRLCPSEWTNPYPCIENPEYLINQFSLRNSFWFMLGSILQQGSEIAPIAYATRMTAGAWWFFTLIIVSTYTANLAAFLTTETPDIPFNDVYELVAKAPKLGIEYGAKAKGATSAFFKGSKQDDFQRIYKHMEMNPGVMVKENHEGVAIADLTITSERKDAVDFTTPFMHLGISILYRKPSKAPPDFFSFAAPYAVEVWIWIGGAYFVTSISLFVMGRLCPSEWTNPYPCIENPEYLINQFSLRNSFWFMLGSILQQGSEIAPIAYATRMTAGAWWFFTLII
ncbi:hypothetical protein AMK59_6319, partial [Oryctes borbonicus]